MRRFTPKIMALSLLLLVAIAICVLPLLGHAHDGERPPAFACRVETPQVPQGGAAFLHIDALGATAVRIAYNEKTVPARQCGEVRWEGVIGVWMEEQPGEHIATIEADTPDGTRRMQAAFTVTKRSFPIQRLRMLKSQDAIYDDPEVAEEYLLIRAALASETPRRWQDAFHLPVTGRISTRYGVQRYRNGKKVGIHKGLDIAAPKGTLVCAANAGTVVLRRSFMLHGNTLVVDHGGGVVGLYLHLSEFGASEGQMVAAGDKIGRVGSTGVATGPHLHYALYVHGVAVDPVLWQTVPKGW